MMGMTMQELRDAGGVEWRGDGRSECLIFKTWQDAKLLKYSSKTRELIKALLGSSVNGEGALLFRLSVTSHYQSNAAVGDAGEEPLGKWRIRGRWFDLSSADNFHSRRETRSRL
jgi:hypothetical protein